MLKVKRMHYCKLEAMYQRAEIIVKFEEVRTQIYVSLRGLSGIYRIPICFSFTHLHTKGQGTARVYHTSPPPTPHLLCSPVDVALVNAPKESPADTNDTQTALKRTLLSMYTTYTYIQHCRVDPTEIHSPIQTRLSESLM